MSKHLHEEGRSVARYAHELRGGDGLEELIARAAQSRFVLIGEATHGTHEFYELRAQFTRHLIQEHGFRAVAWESDWPDTFRAHQFVTGRGTDQSAEDALADFRRFPAWMWRNTVTESFLEWLRELNALKSTRRLMTGVYGMDLYSMHTSIEAVLGYLESIDPEGARRARRRYGCFEHFSVEPQAYGLETTLRGKEPCEDEVIAQLVDIRRRSREFRKNADQRDEEDFFSAEQNARLVMNAERYYRAMFKGRDESWNLRDTHMFETLVELSAYLEQHGPAKIVVWAHNSHLGDARATEMGERGELNVGQLLKERFDEQVFSICLSTYTGSVTAARDWGAATERRRVRPGMEGSYEELLHFTGLPECWIDLREPDEAVELLREERLQRAIGVIYLPETERYSHYFMTRLPDQFDALIHLDVTRALQPLDRSSKWAMNELPETFPTAL